MKIAGTLLGKCGESGGIIGKAFRRLSLSRSRDELVFQRHPSPGALDCGSNSREYPHVESTYCTYKQADRDVTYGSSTLFDQTEAVGSYGGVESPYLVRSARASGRNPLWQ